MALRKAKQGGRSGWTLIELIGVLAIVAILSGIIAVVLISEIKEARRARERELVRRIGDALIAYVKAQREIPGATNWAQAVASMSGLTVDSVLMNSRSQQRIYWIDPSIKVGSSQGDVQLPYRQTAEGSVDPANVRVLIISSVGVALPPWITTGKAPSVQAFEEVWSTKEGTIPLSWNWSGDGSDLVIQRIYLTSLFHRVSFNVIGGGSPLFAVDDSEPQQVLNSPMTRWYIENTVISLYDHRGNLFLKHVVKEDTAFSYTGVEWANEVNLPPVPSWVSPEELQAIADLFRQARPNPNAKFNTTPEDVYQAMQTFLQAYLAWAQAGFPSTGNDPSYKAVRAAQADLAQKSSYLIFRLYDAGR